MKPFKIDRLKVYSCLMFVLLVTACEPQTLTQPDTPNDSVKEISKSDASPVAAEDSNDKFDLAQFAMVASDFGDSNAPERLQYSDKINQILDSDIPILALDGLVDVDAITAQQIFLADSRLQPLLFHADSELPLRNEIMSVKKALPGDLVGLTQGCSTGACYRVDNYNFFYNTTTTGIVDLSTKSMVAIYSLAETQPDISPRLKELAVAIASHHPAVQTEIKRFLELNNIQREQDALQPLMAATKSALRNSLCERSRHLCVAPTYVLGEHALWVIIDLTDLRIVGLQWTKVGKTGPPVVVTQRKIENEAVFKNYCEQISSVERNGWRFNFHLTSSDGLRLADVQFQGLPVLNSIKVVDWHVSYSREANFGYSDATGCPMFSSAVVVAHDGPKIEPIMHAGEEIGFSIVQDFRQLPWPAPCNYRYEERYQFFNDGRYRAVLSNLGRGCGEGGTYRPVLRMELADFEDGNNLAIQEWRDQQWHTQVNEFWSLQPATERMFEQRYSHRLIDSAGRGYLMSPSFGQFADGGRGDDAFIYATINHAEVEEGSADLVTLGSCCNNDFQQGPEQFMQPAEALAGQPMVLWYVPQMQNDAGPDSRYCWAETTVENGVRDVSTWPCTAGPMFTPLTESRNAVEN